MKIRTTRGDEIDVLTRREVIEMWEKQPASILDSPVCPDCRDILFKKENDTWFCGNRNCIFSIKTSDL